MAFPLPPLVEPAADLTADQVARYSRQLILPELGRLGQRRLAAARVLVIGAGGLGSPALQYLAAAGVGTLGVLDDDVVEESNLQRQVLHGQEDLGRAKVDSAAEAIARLNPQVTVVRHQTRLDAGNALGLLAGYHLVLDGTDSFPSRYLISDACALLGLPCVWGSLYRFDGQVSVFWARPPADAGVVPITYRDLFPQPPAPGLAPSCAEGGVLGALCGSIGAAMGTEAIKLICGIGEPLLGRLLVYDGLAASWSSLRIRADPDTPPVTGLAPDYPAFCGMDADPPTESGLTAAELAGWLRRRELGELDFVLVDVREPGEREIAVIPGSLSIPVGGFRAGTALTELARTAAGRPIVLHCKSGARSAEALSLARVAGLSNVQQLAGGVLAWIDEVDPSQPKY